MYKGKSICAVVPAFNEERQIAKVITTMPDIVDHLIIINDCSSDNTSQEVKAYVEKHPKIKLIEHATNQGVGGAIATGYKWVRDNNKDIAVVFAGDAQMEPRDLLDILDPVVNDEVDYSKANRLFSGEAYKKIPKVRYFGNSVLSLLTKIVSGYWHVADSQTGYTAINKKALHLIDWDKMYKRYGQPNDLLVRLNIFDLKVRDVPIQPTYNVGETSGINIGKVMFTIPWLLFKLFFWRMKEKYIIRNFHPLVLFYFTGFVFLFITAILSFRLVYLWIDYGYVPMMTALFMLFTSSNAILFSLFAMWFDMEVNKGLK
ncbi:MAG: glycosyltransferase family 2 protein [Flavobacteriales bacterium]|nr:glycosyltransferase family 2 protein [Flavobacteriales bacterium]